MKLVVLIVQTILASHWILVWFNCNLLSAILGKKYPFFFELNLHNWNASNRDRLFRWWCWHLNKSTKLCVPIQKTRKNCFIHGTDIHCCIQNQHLWSIFTLFKGGIFDVVQKIITIYYYETIVINLIIDIKIVEE